MDTVKDMDNDILYRAQKCLYYNELLIKQCDGWLTAEEGNANMLKAFEEKRKKDARISRITKINRVLSFFGVKKQLSVEIVKNTNDADKRGLECPQQKNPQPSALSASSVFKNRKSITFFKY